FVATAYPGLTRTAYLVLGDRQLAEDVVQNALIGVYRRWGRIEHVDGPGPYARRAVVNAALSELRRPHRRREHGREQLPEALGAAARTLDPAVHLRDETVLAALRELPPGQRTVVVLRHVEDVDVAATARLLGVAEGTVKSQCAKGLATLRARLGGRDTDLESSLPPLGRPRHDRP
ncbi:MAG: SigE family RNA polymerase sigma factor, partial [Lapillicoccus sp.]